MAEEKSWFYGVVYLTNGEASVSAPFDSLDKCIAAMKEGIKRHPDKVASTTYMVRKSSDIITLRQLFGNPKSRDLMQDKKFLAEL